MPELPEVEEARRSVHENCAGRKILAAVAADDTKVIEGVTAAELQAALEGRTLVAAKRKGKNLWLELDQRPWPLFHFGMAGAIIIQGTESVHYKRSLVSEDEEWPPKYHRLLLEFEGGVRFAFVDFRRFARIRLQQNPLEMSPVSELGPDAFLELPELPDFASALRKRKSSLKAVLLDQAFVAGVGNWVADEVLYQARIHPEQAAQTLPDEDCERLHTSLKKVLELAVKVNADSAHFPASWIFHKRWDKKPGAMNGHPIAFITVGGRTSAYVPALQKDPGGGAKKAIRKKMVVREETKTAVVKKLKGKASGSAKKKGKKGQKAEEQEEEEKELEDGDGNDPVMSMVGNKATKGRRVAGNQAGKRKPTKVETPSKVEKVVRSRRKVEEVQTVKILVEKKTEVEVPVGKTRARRKGQSTQVKKEVDKGEVGKKELDKEEKEDKEEEKVNGKKRSRAKEGELDTREEKATTKIKGGGKANAKKTGTSGSTSKDSVSKQKRGAQTKPEKPTAPVRSSKRTRKA